MKTPTKRATRRLAASLAIITALATTGAWAHIYVGNTAGQAEVCDETGRSESGFYVIGGTSSATGIVNNVSGTLTVSSWMAVGWAAGSYGELNIKSGAVTVNGATSGAGVFVGYDSSAEAGLAEGHLVVDGGSLNVKNDFIVGRNGTGTLTINGGTVEVGSSTTEKWTKLGIGSGTIGTINLNGGQLKLWHVRKDGSGTASFVFNGGTLVANGVSSQGLIYSNLPVTVNPGGGTIDNGNLAIYIAAALSGAGGLTFTGGNTITLNGDINYSGVTGVAPGTTLKANKARVSSILSKGIALVGEPAVGTTYTILTSDDDLSDLTLAGNVKCPIASDFTPGFADGGKSITVTVTALNPGWYIGPANGDLSNSANWSDGNVPSANASFALASPATLTKGASFAPTSITFGEGCAPVTIDGGELSGITAITNLSSVRHVFNCAVSGNEIDFRNASHCCVFRGGITVATPVFANSPENANARAIVGDWTITSAWSPVSYNELGRDDATGSSITVQGELQNPNNIVIYQGSVLTAETMKVTSSTYSAWTNNGRLVITGMVDIANTSKDFSLARTDGENATIIAGGIVYNTGNWPWLNAKTLVLGTDGINFDSSHNNNLRFSGTPTLYASGAATTLHAGKDDLQAYSIGNGKTLTVCTTQFGSTEPSTITIDGKILETFNVTGHYSGGMGVTGNGTLVFNSESTFNGGLTVGDTATVKVNENCTPGSSDITLGAGTTLTLTATGNVFTPLANTLNLPTGENKVATIRIDGKRLRSGEGLEIATIGNASSVNKDNVKIEGDAIGGRKTTLRIEDDKLLLNVQPDGLMVIFR